MDSATSHEIYTSNNCKMAASLFLKDKVLNGMVSNALSLSATKPFGTHVCFVQVPLRVWRNCREDI